MKLHLVLAALGLALLALLTGCGTTPSAPSATLPAPVVGAPAAPPPVPEVSLAAEQRRLADLFRGTPVVFEMQGDSLRVEVPLKYCFDKGHAAVKPPLAAVLDRIVPSAKSRGHRTRVAAPADNHHGGTTLAQDRAASTRDYLIAKGVPPTHFAGLSTRADSIEIVIGKL